MYTSQSGLREGVLPVRTGQKGLSSLPSPPPLKGWTDASRTFLLRWRTTVVGVEEGIVRCPSIGGERNPPPHSIFRSDSTDVASSVFRSVFCKFVY